MMDRKTVFSTIMATGAVVLAIALGIIFSQQWQIQRQLTRIEARLGSTSAESLLIEEQFGGTTWRVVYAHDENGRATAGDINALIGAVENGQPVRMIMTLEGHEPHIAEAEHLWIRGGGVYAQNTSLVSLSITEGVSRFQDDSFHWRILVNTRGDRDMIRWNVGEHVLRGHTSDKVSISWAIQ